MKCLETSLRKIFLFVSILCIWGFNPDIAFGQEKNFSTTFDKITITDAILDSVLNVYTKEVDSKVIAIATERYDGDYTYTLFNVNTYEGIVRNPTTFYKRWKDRILLIYVGTEKIFNVDSTQVKTFYRKMRPILPNSYVTTKIGKNIYESTIMTYEPIIWQLRTGDGTFLSLRKKIDHGLEKISYFNF